MKKFDHESLSAFNGQDGKPVYIAYQGRVFDVSASKLWKGGLHMKRHRAAQDLTSEIQAAPHGEEVFERYPQVGVLTEKPVVQRSMSAFLSSLLERFPSLERHPHPMTVHFPIVFLLSAPFFNFLYLIAGNGSFENTAFYCLVAGVLFMPVAMLTGLFSWWLNYLARPMKQVKIKIVLSIIVLIFSLSILFWRIAEPGLMYTAGARRTIYFLITLSCVPIISVIGWLGAGLTFPTKKT
jgi:predicted heme/steroid binding protein/uncharacterized membrane protein